MSVLVSKAAQTRAAKCVTKAVAEHRKVQGLDHAVASGEWLNRAKATVGAEWKTWAITHVYPSIPEKTAMLYQRLATFKDTSAVKGAKTVTGAREALTSPKAKAKRAAKAEAAEAKVIGPAMTRMVERIKAIAKAPETVTPDEAKGMIQLRSTISAAVGPEATLTECESLCRTLGQSPTTVTPTTLVRLQALATVVAATVAKVLKAHAKIGLAEQRKAA